MRVFIECNKFGDLPFGLKANSWLNSPDIAQSPSTFPPSPIKDEIGEGNGGGIRRGGRNDLRPGANDSQFSVAICFKNVEKRQLYDRKAFIFHNLFINVAIFTATSFPFTEYQYADIFIVAIVILLFLFLDSIESFSTSSQPCSYNKTMMCKLAPIAAYSTISFLFYDITFVVFGFLRKKNSTYANVRTTLEARKGPSKVFIIAFRLGVVMGFLLIANGLLVLYIAINLFKLYYGDDWGDLFESTTDYGFGRSSMALFDRVSGVIYTKATTIGANDVDILMRNILEDDPRNLVFIADNVGDNVGGIAGIFGSYATPSCAAIIVESISSIGVNHDLTTIMYTLLVIFVGILIRLLKTLFATNFCKSKAVKEIELTLKRQWIILTASITVGIALVTWIPLLSLFTIFNSGTQKVVKN
ncbi:hypothetical protein Nepgr_002098 [Nepenthes gracilis]|uniref:H(+)-exporting diphosphatase n=1 Tax=Nepenthes gracilis TaxID=150966 RepID=A0AAD3RXJ5_NEPGR|nr:hypothetical protein Nepgr_002098 [Nepenthes gracilis]